MAEKSNEELLDAYTHALRDFAASNPAKLAQARAAVLARMCGPGEVVVPTRPDKGPFEWCGDDGDFIVSRDFIYDAGLKLSGDFPDDQTKRAYMQRVMDILNAARPNGETDDQGK